MKANGLKTKKMVWESIFILMEQDMMVIGKMEILMALADVCMLTVKYMKVNGFKIKSMVLVNKDIQMEEFIKESGIMIKEKVKVK